jgi:hypothetical protein
MPTTSVRQRILEAYKTRLQAILIASGYQTDAGQHIFMEEVPALGPDDSPIGIVILVGDDEPAHTGANLSIKLPVHIAAVAPATQGDAWTQIEAVLADIKRSIEQVDRTFGGLVRSGLERGPTRTLPRAPGSLTVGRAIEYRNPYVEGWGTP